jgi:outer membrane protein OmpA-like peptidoglycan-associated protein
MQRERAGELIFEGCPSQGCPQPTLKTRPAAMAPSPVLASAPLPGDRAASSGSQGAPVPGVAVFFGTGKARIDAGSLALLDAVASKASGSSWRLKVTGRTDSRGAPAVNARLAEARARAVARHLQRRGIDAQRIAIATDIREDSSLRDGVRAAAVPPDAQARARRAEISVERA